VLVCRTGVLVSRTGVLVSRTGVLVCRTGVQVYVGDYHREQAWQRWLKKASGVDTEGVKTKLRRVANALTVEDADRALAELETSLAFTSSSRLGNWFSNTWKPHLMARPSLVVSCSVCFLIVQH